MFAVIFEVEINEERKNEYLIIASILKEQLVNQKGFISVERFQSLINEKNFHPGSGIISDASYSRSTIFVYCNQSIFIIHREATFI